MNTTRPLHRPWPLPVHINPKYMHHRTHFGGPSMGARSRWGAARRCVRVRCQAPSLRRLCSPRPSGLYPLPPDCKHPQASTEGGALGCHKGGRRGGRRSLCWKCGHNTDATKPRQPSGEPVHAVDEEVGNSCSKVDA